MSFENPVTTNPSEKKPAPKDMTRGLGMLRAGEERLQGTTKTEKFDPKKYNEEKSWGKKQTLEKLFPETGVLEATNFKAAFESMMNETKASWEVFGEKGLQSQEKIIEIRKVTEEYLSVFRSTASDRQSRMKAIRDEFKKITSSSLN